MQLYSLDGTGYPTWKTLRKDVITPVNEIIQD